jgi:hypothetical protein
MSKTLFGRRSVALGLIAAAAAATPAYANQVTSPAPAGRDVAAAHSQAPVAPAQGKLLAPAQGKPVAPARGKSAGSSSSGLSTVDTSQCVRQTFSQPFAPFGDFGFYTLMPGQSVDNFTGTGWTLTGGASIVTTKLGDGSTGSVLNLPGGSSAISPPMCVSSNYPIGRTFIRDVRGASGVQFSVSYEGTRTWVKPRNTGLIHGNAKAWTVSHRFNLQPYRTVGWQIVRFRLSAHRGDYQLYNVYVDPHMHL